MISPFHSSSISLAMRTAQHAEARVAKTAEQIATGKKVNSVKDDGAAYVRAAALKSDQVQIEARGQVMSILRSASESQSVIDELHLEYLDKARAIVTSARLQPPNSAARTALQVEYDNIMLDWQRLFGEWQLQSSTYGNWGAAGWGIQPHLSDPILSQNAIWHQPATGLSWATATTANGLAVKDNNMIAASDTYLINLYSALTTRKTSYYSYMNFSRSDQVWLDNVEKNDARTSDNIELAISSLTDADMGEVAKERDLAQSRQQLAYQTIQNALTHYGNISNGLLNNVLGTQRSISA